jgi:hypothetical protein
MSAKTAKVQGRSVKFPPRKKEEKIRGRPFGQIEGSPNHPQGHKGGSTILSDHIWRWTNHVMAILRGILKK